MSAFFDGLTPRELANAVTPLYTLPNRHQKAALDELVRRCERAELLLEARSVGEETQQ